MKNMKALFSRQGRKNGVLFAIIVWSTYLVLPIPVSATQGKISFGLTEIIILLLGMYELILLCRQKYILKGLYRKIFIAVAAACAVSLAICMVHVLLHGKSLFEFVGILRNLYACALIFFAVDAGILDKEEVLNGLVLLVFISEIIALTTTIANNILGTYLPAIFADHRFVAVAGVALIPYAVLKGRSPKLLYLSWGLILPNVMLCGRRTETAAAFGLMILMYLCMLFKKNKTILRMFVRANILGIVLTIALSIILILGFESGMAEVHLFRSMPGLVQIVNKTNPHNGGNESQVNEAMQQGIESGERSNSVRFVLWGAFGERIKESPLIGTGERTIRINMKTALELLGGLSLGYDDGEEQVMVAHNFIIEMLSAEGVIGFLAYAAMMLYLYGNVLIRFKMDWLEKLFVLVFTGTFYVFGLVQPSISGGITSNIYIWSFLGYIYAENRDREKLKEAEWGQK